MSSFKDKVVLVTGACGGMGTQTVRLFAKRLASLVLVDLNDADLNVTAAMCRKEGSPAVLSVKADLTQKKDIEKVVTKTLEYFKKVDVLVNNAGIYIEKGIPQTSWEDYDKLMDVNLKAPFFLIQGFMPELIKTKGCVVNISSIASKIPSTLYAAYAVTKAGLSHLSRISAQENAKFGVRVNSICPGTADTKLTGSSEKPLMVRIMSEPFQPLGGLVKPESIAVWIVFLASGESGPITGQDIFVDGGFVVTKVPTGYTPPKAI